MRLLTTKIAESILVVTVYFDRNDRKMTHYEEMYRDRYYDSTEMAGWLDSI